MEQIFAIVTTIFPLILLFVLMYFMVIRPQKKEQSKHKALLANLKKGDKVVMTSGIYGTIESIDETTVNVSVGSGMGITFDKLAVMQVRDQA
ncbi:MAG: preprotein translocase subunit YajC [Culicoidibacterales bacterium]